MSNWLRKFAAARESSWYKVEQEADLQRHRRRLLKGEGRIEQIAGAGLGPRRERSFAESVHAFEVDMGILQQQARIDDPDAARRKEVVRRIRGAPAELTDLERLQYRSVAYGLAASLTLPRASLGRDRFHVASQGLAAAQPQPLTPLAQAAETGRFAAAVRSLAYGSAAGLAGAAIVGALMYRLWLSTQDSQEPSWQERLLTAGRPWGDAVRLRLGVSEQEAGAAAAEPGSRLGETGEEFTRQISARLRRSIGLPAQRPEREDPSKQLQLQRDEANLHAAAQSAAAD